MIVIKKLLLLLLFLSGIAVLLFMASRSEDKQIMGTLINRVETDQKVVALTFDDGPAPGYTQELLDILETHDIKATFYLVGNEIERHEEETNAILTAGHEIGNHSWTHQRMVFKTQQFVANEIESTDKVIHEAGYTGEIYFRPPYGKKLITLPFYLYRNNRTSIIWDVAPESDLGATATVSELVEYTLTSAKPGSIILLHVMHPSRKNTMLAVPEIITGLRAEGYEFVTVSELLKENQ